MEYTNIQVDRNSLREELVKYLRENRENLILPTPEGFLDPSWGWADHTSRVGLSLNEFVSEVYKRLLSTGRATRTSVPVSDSSTMNAYNAYYPTHVKFLILEEIFELIRAGVLIEARFERADARNFDFQFDFGKGQVVLTEYGAQFIADSSIVPYFAEQYFNILRQIDEPDDTLKNYLSEGLACIRNRLGRAAAVLLRLAAVHILDLLIDSTKNVVSEKERDSLERKIRSARARNNIQDQAEAIFRKLESTERLVPPLYRNEVANRLRAAFHAIRRLGGDAAHSPSPILLEEVRDHYTLYASLVYTIVMEIIRYQNQIS